MARKEIRHDFAISVASIPKQVSIAIASRITGMQVEYCASSGKSKKKQILSQILRQFSSMDIHTAVSGRHASTDVKYYCLYMYYFQGVSKAKLAKLFNCGMPSCNVADSTISLKFALDCI